jgi:hypothetical protein
MIARDRVTGIFQAGHHNKHRAIEPVQSPEKKARKRPDSRPASLQLPSGVSTLDVHAREQSRF